MKSPDEYIIDYSKALLGAITQAFSNHMSLQEYSEAYFKILNKDSESNQVLYFIRIDVDHMVQMVCRWKCLQGQRMIKDLYIRSIGLLIQANSLDYFEKVLKNILILAMAEFDGYSEFKNNVPAEEARMYLENLITNISNNFNYNEEEFKGISNDEIFFCDPETLTEYFKDQPLTIMDWIQNIKQIALNEALIAGNSLNAYHCPDLVRPLLRICIKFPLWSGVMVNYFSCPNIMSSSARIEGYFLDLKSTVIDKRKSRPQVGKFPVNHLRSIRGLIQLAKNEFNNTINEEYITETPIIIYTSQNNNSNDIEDNLDIDDNDDNFNKDQNSLHEMESTNNYHSNEVKELNEVENSKNKAIVIKKRKSFYSIKHPEIKTKRQATSIHRIDNALNGHLMEPYPTNENSKVMYKVLNTCPFDAVLQSFATGYIDSIKYAEYIDNTQNKIMMLAKYLVDHGANSNFYMERTSILEPIGNKSKLICGLTELDCRYNVNDLLELLIKDEPSIWEYNTCNIEAEQTVVPKIFFPINLNELVKGSFTNLQNAIDNMVPHPLSSYTRKCYRSNCNGTITVTKVLGQHLWLDTIYNIETSEENLTCALNDIPHQITINNNTYRFVAVIGYVRESGHGLGHYIAYCRRIHGYWEEHDDLAPKIKQCCDSKIVKPHAILYTKI